MGGCLGGNLFLGPFTKTGPDGCRLLVNSSKKITVASTIVAIPDVTNLPLFYRHKLQKWISGAIRN